MCADLSLAAKKLKYQPLVPLTKGLRLTYENDPLVGPPRQSK
jgi:hypothetical protein